MTLAPPTVDRFFEARVVRLAVVAFVCFVSMLGVPSARAESPVTKELQAAFPRDVAPLLQRFCFECHAGERIEGELDLSSFGDYAAVRRNVQAWQKVAEMLESEQMPPKDSKQLSPESNKQLRQWVKQFLTDEAAAHAGDPGPVVLRRLNNAEYTYTVRELTGVESLDPAKEFPVDSASGEGFTNVGNSLVMSPTLLTKYLDAAKDIASHAVLLPDGIAFSPAVTRRDRTNASLARIRQFYNQFASADGGSAVNLQGVQFQTNQGGRLPVQAYLAATLANRDALRKGDATFEDVARQHGLNANYLKTLWASLVQEPAGQSLPLDALRIAWRKAGVEDAPQLANFVGEWQAALWKFHPVGQYALGEKRSWMEAASPIVARQEIRLAAPPATDGQEVVLYLVANAASASDKSNAVVWERPRFVFPGGKELLLRDVRPVARALLAQREQLYAQTAKCLEAAAEASNSEGEVTVAALARKHEVEPRFLSAWLAYLGLTETGDRGRGALLERKHESADHKFIRGWISDDALSVLANSSDQHVRIPGNMRPNSIAVHPAPEVSVAVGWTSPRAGSLRVIGSIEHAHPECGNGVAWSLELQRRGMRRRLAEGTAQGAKAVVIGPVEKLSVRAGDVVTLLVHPRDRNHSCDLTAIDLTLSDGEQEWNLTRDVAPDILAGNPHAGAHGNQDMWRFSSVPNGAATPSAPINSLLAKWQFADKEEQSQLAADVQRLLQGELKPAQDSADAALYRQLTSLSGPLALTAIGSLKNNESPAKGDEGDAAVGLDPALFGKDLDGRPIDAASLCVSVPQVLEVRVPAALVAGAEFVSGGALHEASSLHGVQLQVVSARPAAAQLTPGAPIIAREGTAGRQQLEASLDAFRQLFPAALCYSQIVPVDEVVTLTLYYREDHHLRRLMLTEEEARLLDRYWDELLYIAEEPLEMVTAYDQLTEFATQDRPDVVETLKPLRQPIRDAAEAFRKRQIENEPRQVEALLAFAHRAYRRPLTAAEGTDLRDLYAKLREEGLTHDDALRLTLARVFVAPAFLYRLERPGPGAKATPLSDWELASRLSYFLWSSPPDEELRTLAAAGRLRDPDTLAAQARRMLKDPKARRLATEFACQWLQIYEFHRHDEKSEQAFPTFADLRGAMYEESVLFLTDLFQNDRPITSILDADHTFLNEGLAHHYGVPDVKGAEWRLVEGVKRYARGGVLAQATVLSKQSGASRTSPILRGNWISEVVLGERLPRPPKDVPVLADAIPEGLSERQLIERHTSDASCAKCHVRIDPFGFALESYDAIGRHRTKDAAGLPIDAKTIAPDGVPLDGLSGLQDYLLGDRKLAFARQFNRKLLGYALGRSVRLSDESLLAQMQTALETHDHRVTPVIEIIVRSPQFRNIRGLEWAAE